MASRGGLSLDLTHMNKVLRVSAEDLDCTVEAGVTREQLNAYLRDQGTMAIVLVEQFFDFAVDLADRIAVMYRGSVIGEVTDVGNATTTEIGLLMAGIVEPAEAGR